MPRFIPTGPHLWDLVSEHRISSETIDPPAERILDIFRSLEGLASGGRPVFLLHFPRGATPIVEGLKYAWWKQHGSKRMPFRILDVPVSRENLDPKEANRLIKQRLELIPANSVVMYVDEAHSGVNASQNIRLMSEVLKDRSCELHSHLLVNQNGRHLSEDARRRLQHMRQFRGSQTVFHSVPELLPWMDDSRRLGQNWGLHHKFPFDLVVRACGKRFHVAADVKKFRRAFEEEYARLAKPSDSPAFQRVRFPAGKFHLQYGGRDDFVLRALKVAIEKSGFGKKYAASMVDRDLVVQGTHILIPRVIMHFADTHPSHEIKRGRADYAHHLELDSNTLVDFSHSGRREPGKRAVTVLQRGSYDLMHALKASIGLRIHNQNHPKHRKPRHR